MRGPVVARNGEAVRALSSAMPGCRKLDAFPTTPRPTDGRVVLSHYVRLRARPPRPANDNRRAAGPALWHWALLVGIGPVFGLIAAVSVLI